MLEPLYHTRLGGLMVAGGVACTWVLGAISMVVITVSMADFTYGVSLLLWAVITMRGRRNQQACLITLLVPCAIAGPRDQAAPGFQRFWIAYFSMVFLAWLGWFAQFRPWPAFLQLMFDLDAPKAFRRCEVRGALDDVQKEGSLFAFHPHGILCVGFGVNGMWTGAFRDIAGSNTHFGVDKVLREDNPFFKTISDWHGKIVTLDKGSMLGLMAKNSNIAFVPGGFQDATCMKYGVESTVISKRKGFIKYALQYGYRVHPVYTFGECKSFYTFTGLQHFRLWLNEYGVPGVVPFGCPWFPICPRWNEEYYTYLGKAIQLPKITEPTSEEVDRWHGVYVDSLKQLFEEHKADAGLAPSAKLNIL